MYAYQFTYSDTTQVQKSKIQQYENENENFKFSNSTFSKNKALSLLTFAHNANSLSSINILLSTVVIPFMNPDGYQFVLNSLTDPNSQIRKEDLELTLKNRNILNPSCQEHLRGINLRNNYPYQFGFDDQGSSPSICNIHYRGPESLSELEGKRLQELLNRIHKLYGQIQIALNIDSHKEITALLQPNNFGGSLDLAYQTFFLDDSLGLKIGNSLEIFGRDNNGDLDDWLFHQFKILSLSMFLAPLTPKSNTIFIDQEQIKEIYWVNILPIYEILMRSHAKLRFTDRSKGPQLCWGGTIPECNGYQNNLQDMFIYHEIEITNYGLRDIEGQSILYFKTKLKIDKLYLRLSRTNSYKEYQYKKNSENDTYQIQIGSIRSNMVQSVGLLFIYHINQKIRSLEEYHQVNQVTLSNKTLDLEFHFEENLIGIQEEQYEYNLLKLYKSIPFQTSEGQQKATSVISYLFYIVCFIAVLIIPLQLQFNIFRINKERENDYIHKAYEIELTNLEQKKLGLQELSPPKEERKSSEVLQSEYSTMKSSDYHTQRALLNSQRSDNTQFTQSNTFQEQEEIHQFNPPKHIFKGNKQRTRPQTAQVQKHQKLPNLDIGKAKKGNFVDPNDLSKITEEDKGLEVSVIQGEPFQVSDQQQTQPQKKGSVKRLRVDGGKDFENSLEQKNNQSLLSSQPQIIEEPQKEEEEGNDEGQQQYWFYPGRDTNEDQDVDNEGSGVEELSKKDSKKSFQEEQVQEMEMHFKKRKSGEKRRKSEYQSSPQHSKVSIEEYDSDKERLRKMKASKSERYN